MDEVQARRAQQRVANIEDWLGRLKDDLAAGHSREAMTHLLTAQAELRILTEQMAADTGWVAAPEAAVSRSQSAIPGIPRRNPWTWAAMAAMIAAFAMVSSTLLPHRNPASPNAPIIDQGLATAVLSEPTPSFPAPVTTTNTPPAEVLAAAEPIPAPILQPTPDPALGTTQRRTPRATQPRPSSPSSAAAILSEPEPNLLVEATNPIEESRPAPPADAVSLDSLQFEAWRAIRESLKQ